MQMVRRPAFGRTSRFDRGRGNGRGRYRRSAVGGWRRDVWVKMPLCRHCLWPDSSG